MVDFGSALKSLRKQHKMTQEQLAKRLNLTKSVISAYENNLRLPSYDVLLNIARIFKVSTDYLLGNDAKIPDTLDLSGLSEDEKQAVKNLIAAMKKK
ncbi:MAG: helix-turn-helix domain-containing protein [Clostridia bacterium]